jgi:Uma2 family endonuclease
MATQTLMTVEQFLESAKAQDERWRFELRNGEIVEMASTNGWHNFVRDSIMCSL